MNIEDFPILPFKDVKLLYDSLVKDLENGADLYCMTAEESVVASLLCYIIGDKERDAEEDDE